jgi:hypothetical protein
MTLPALKEYAKTVLKMSLGHGKVLKWITIYFRPYYSGWTETQDIETEETKIVEMP